MPLVLLRRLHVRSTVILLTPAVCRFCLWAGVMVCRPFSLHIVLLRRRSVLCAGAVGAAVCLVLDVRIKLVLWLCSLALIDVLGVRCSPSLMLVRGIAFPPSPCRSHSLA